MVSPLLFRIAHNVINGIVHDAIIFALTEKTTVIIAEQILHSISVQPHLYSSSPIGFKKMNPNKQFDFTLHEANIDAILNRTLGNFQL